MNDLDDLLRRDPIAQAERITGGHRDDRTLALGALLMIDANDRKRAALAAAGDTRHGMSHTEHLAVWRSLGFETVLEEPTPGDSGTETLTLLWHPDGLLGACESYTYSPHRIATNSSSVYYNWEPSPRVMEQDTRWALTSSGRMCDGVWCGDHDTREALAHKLTRLRENGAFRNPWTARPSILTLIGYGEGKMVDALPDLEARTVRRAQITAERIGRLPAHVRDSITPGA